MAERTFDAVVIGAGPAGEVCAGRLGDAGLTVALIERHLVGGECSFYGCMPSKALLRPPELLHETQRVPGVREAASGKLDVAAVLARRDEVIHDLDDSGMLPWLEHRHVTLIRGQARLDGERRVRVGDDLLVATRAVVVATGTEAAVPPIPGLREAKPWTNREATTAATVPHRLLVLGGGVVGVELAQAYAALGARVTVVEALERLLAREEPFASELVASALREAGVDVETGVRASAVARDGDGGEVTLTLADGKMIAGDELLVAIGRRPLTGSLGLDTVGLDDDGYLDVDDRLRVGGRDWLYAIGDANGIALLTHMGKYQARVAAAVISGRDARVRDHGPLSPRVVFTEPQVAAVGHTLASALAAGIEARAVDVDTSSTAGASFIGRNAPGTSRLVIDTAAGVVVGATFSGIETADFLHAATIAVVAKVPLDDLWHSIPSFPTRSEIWLSLLEHYGL